MDWELTRNLPRKRLSIRNKHLEVYLAAIQHDALVLPNASATYTSSSLAQLAASTAVKLNEVRKTGLLPHGMLVLDQSSWSPRASESPIGRAGKEVFWDDGLRGCMQKESLAFSSATWKSPGRSGKCPWSARRPKDRDEQTT
jgi:hypothetical protein